MSGPTHSRVTSLREMRVKENFVLGLRYRRQMLASPHRVRGQRRHAVVGTQAADLTLPVEQFHFEDQRRIRRDDTAGSAGAVAELGRDDERALAADLHG